MSWKCWFDVFFLFSWSLSLQTLRLWRHFIHGSLLLFSPFQKSFLCIYWKLKSSLHSGALTFMHSLPPPLSLCRLSSPPAGTLPLPPPLQPDSDTDRHVCKLREPQRERRTIPSVSVQTHNLCPVFHPRWGRKSKAVVTLRRGFFCLFFPRRDKDLEEGSKTR